MDLGRLKIKCKSKNKKQTQEVLDEKSKSPFIMKLNAQRQFQEDKDIENHQMDKLNAIQASNYEGNNTISEVESGASGINSSEDSQSSKEISRRKHSPIFSHAKQLLEVHMENKRIKKAGKFKIAFSSSNIIIKRIQLSGRNDKEVKSAQIQIKIMSGDGTEDRAENVSN